MNIVSIFTLDHTMDYELTHCEQIAKVTIRIKVNFDKAI